MIWLSLLVTLAFIPGVTGAAIPTGWMAMSFVLPWMVWGRVVMSLPHYLGLGFLAYVLGSIAWTPDRFDGVWELWHWALFGLCFILGSQTTDLSGFWKGLALGCGVSSAIAMVQWYGGAEWQILPNSNWAKPPGLFFNDAVAGSIAALTLVGLASQSLWRWFPLPLPLFLLSQSRGAWLAVIATWIIAVLACMRWRERFFFSLALLGPAIGALLWFHTSSDSIRLEIWHEMAGRLLLFGHGVGSTQSLYTIIGGQLFHIEHAHNDYLNLAYEYGLGATPLFALVALLASARQAAEWPPYICGLVLCLYFWTLETSVAGYILSVVAGRLAADVDLAWAHGLGRRLGFVLRNVTRGRSAHA